jgi:hypothetical protein
MSADREIASPIKRANTVESSSRSRSGGGGGGGGKQSMASLLSSMPSSRIATGSNTATTNSSNSSGTSINRRPFAAVWGRAFDGLKIALCRKLQLVSTANMQLTVLEQAAPPTKRDLEACIKFVFQMKTWRGKEDGGAKNDETRQRVNNLYKFWKAIAQGKPAKLTMYHRSRSNGGARPRSQSRVGAGASAGSAAGKRSAAAAAASHGRTLVTPRTAANARVAALAASNTRHQSVNAGRLAAKSSPTPTYAPSTSSTSNRKGAVGKKSPVVRSSKSGPKGMAVNAHGARF